MADPSPSDHFDGERFFNPDVVTDKSWRQLWHWRRTRRPAAWPERVGNGGFPPPPAAVAGRELAVTYIGHATFLAQVAGCNMLTDPIFSERASPLPWTGPRRVRPPALALDDLPRIDLVLLSHNHYDHMDLPSLRALHRRWNPVIVTGLRNGRYLAGKGVGNTVELDWWQHHQAAGDARITFVPAQHWSSRSLWDRRHTLWGGHVVETAAGRLYFAGDTGYPARFGEIARRLGPPDLALLPIGAYEPRWFMANQHMDPDEAVQAHLDLGARLSVAMHFATFPLADEAMDAPTRRLSAALEAKGVSERQFRIPGFGETILWRGNPAG